MLLKGAGKFGSVSPIKHLPTYQMEKAHHRYQSQSTSNQTYLHELGRQHKQTFLFDMVDYHKHHPIGKHIERILDRSRSCLDQMRYKPIVPV